MTKGRQDKKKERRRGEKEKYWTLAVDDTAVVYVVDCTQFGSPVKGGQKKKNGLF